MVLVGRIEGTSHHPFNPETDGRVKSLLKPRCRFMLRADRASPGAQRRSAAPHARRSETDVCPACVYAVHAGCAADRDGVPLARMPNAPASSLILT